MPSRELRIHPAAIREVEEARIWYASVDPELGERFTAEAELAGQAALDAPARWAPDVMGRRRIRLRTFPHVIIYEWEEPVVRILAVAHPSRRPGYWHDRD
jgi:plasmid stabilization system protein ParE